VSIRKAKTKLLLSERALRDIADIEAYSIAQWGTRTAGKYIVDLEQAMARVKENPQLLRPQADFHTDLRFYRVNKHLLVCDVQPKAIYLLAVIHASRDIPNRLVELQPMLAAEVELLHRKLNERKKR
jgi:toxin ParE1/3/4